MKKFTIGLKVSSKEKEALEASAKEKNLNLTEHLRQSIFMKNDSLNFYKSLTIILFYNGCQLSIETIDDLNFIINSFEQAKPKLNTKQKALINQVIFEIQLAIKEIEGGNEDYDFNLDIDLLLHELFLNFLDPKAPEAWNQ